MKRLFNNKYFIGFFVCFILGSATAAWAQPPVPSRWQGEITGTVQNKPFRLVVDIELKQPILDEENPFHLFIGAGEPENTGHLFLTSAIQLENPPGSGRLVTLQYLTIRVQGSRIQSTLTDVHSKESAKANGFSGPNVSAEEASDLMKDILKNAWGKSEMFGFNTGAAVSMEFTDNQISGTIQGRGYSYTGSSSLVPYRGQFRARRVQ